jgi:hypothetical protein
MHPPVTHVNGFETTGDVFERGPDGSAVENRYVIKRMVLMVEFLCANMDHTVSFKISHVENVPR